MKKLYFLIIGIICSTLTPLVAQQAVVSRIDQMPDKPSPYLMRNWKQVAKDYDNYVFDTSKTGNYLPLTTIGTGSGTNYSDIQNIRMSTYVGQSSATTAEAINIMPAIVGASLVGVDKTNHHGVNWVAKVKDFYNLKNGQHVYLNGYSSKTGNDWWYEIMPNVYFYQLYSLYPIVDNDFKTQFTTIADIQLDVVSKLGGKLHPWEAPNMNYRAFNLTTGLPKTDGVPEPETAGTIAWILYQAYKETGDQKYKQGAELALDFLQSWTTNPSYELQLPYGIITAARLNAEQGANYDIDKFMSWAFSGGSGTLRNWGCIVGNWNGYDMSGLIGEANDGGNDYAFIMNGFQHAAALAPVAKYDKKYAKVLSKWILNLSNASRFFYPDALPEANQESASYAWANANNTKNFIPFEAIKQTWQGKAPYAAGDAVREGWAPTDLSLYSGSSVGYLASIINTTNVEGVLQIDLNRTDFRGENTYPNYLYYNPNAAAETVNITLPVGSYDIYDAISETVLKTNVSGTTNFNIAANDIRLLVIYPTGVTTVVEGHKLVVNGGGIIDFHHGYSYTTPLRIKSFSSDKVQTVNPDVVQFNCLVENNVGTVTYKWTVNNAVIAGATASQLDWTAPTQSGVYEIQCVATNAAQTVASHIIKVSVASVGTIAPIIETLDMDGANPYNKSAILEISATANTIDATVAWQCSDGTLTNDTGLTPKWNLPNQEGVYSITLTLTNLLGTTSVTKEVLVKDLDNVADNYMPVIYYSFDGNTKNNAQDAFHATLVGANLSTDALDRNRRAYTFADNTQYIYTPNNVALNFADKIAVSLWVKPDELGGGEQFLISHGSWEDRYKISVNPEKNVRFTINTTSGIVDVDDPTPLTVGVYVHYAGVFTGYSVELYRDGVLVAYKALDGTIKTTTKSITIARKDEATQDYTFKGSIDEVRIYNSDLNTKYIKELKTLWNENAGGDVSIAQLKVGGRTWNIGDRYVVDCGSTVASINVEIESYPGATANSNNIVVDISNPSVQEIGFSITSDDGLDSQDYKLVIEKRFDFGQLVSQRWNNVLTVNNNPATNGNYVFTAYQWFKNGNMIGDGKQYYTADKYGKETLDTDSEYSVQVTTNKGEVLSTCSAKPVLKSIGTKVYPNPATAGSDISVEVNAVDYLLNGAKISIYNMSGIEVKSLPVQSNLTRFALDASGVYALKLTLSDGSKHEVKVVVK